MSWKVADKGTTSGFGQPTAILAMRADLTAKREELAQAHELAAFVQRASVGESWSVHVIAVLWAAEIHVRLQDFYGGRDHLERGMQTLQASVAAYTRQAQIGRNA